MHRRCDDRRPLFSGIGSEAHEWTETGGGERLGKAQAAQRAHHAWRSRIRVNPCNLCEILKNL